MNVKLIVLICLLVTTTFSGCISTGDGFQTDKISYFVPNEGLIFKTPTVIMEHDSPVAIQTCEKNGCSTHVDRNAFGVENNQTLIDQLAQYTKYQNTVTVYFHKNLFVFPWEASDGDIIYKVERVS